MDGWLWSVLGWICGTFVVVKIIAGCWCFAELRREWRAVPELWGVDWLDIVFRLEREFGVKLTAADLVGWPPAARVALTAGQLWMLVAMKITATGRETPANGWERAVAAFAEALNVKRNRIAPSSRLYADLGMIDGID